MTNEEYKKQKELGKILRNLYAYYETDKVKLITFLYSEGYTLPQVATVLDVTRQAIAQRYPKHKLLDKDWEREKENIKEDDLRADL